MCTDEMTSSTPLIDKLKNVRDDVTDLIKTLVKNKPLSDEDVEEGEYFLENVNKGLKKIQKLIENASSSVEYEISCTDQEDTQEVIPKLQGKYR